MQPSHPCQVSELVFIRYTVDFRPGKVFAESLNRLCPEGYTYAQLLANAYNAYNPGASVMPHQITILTIQNGWR